MIAAEWVKFRTVRGWVLAAVAAAIAVAGLGLRRRRGAGELRRQLVRAAARPGRRARVGQLLLRAPGPDGQRLRHRAGGAAGEHGDAAPPVTVPPWAKAIIIKASLQGGAAYAAVMVTGGHGVRLQDDFTGDIAGPAMTAGWLRLARTGDTVTGYASPDGTAWTRVGAVTLPGLPATVQGGLFVTSPQYTQVALGVAQITGDSSQSTAAFSHVAVGWPAGQWTGTDVGAAGPASGPATGYTTEGGTFTVTGSGDIAPVTDGPSGPGVSLAQTLGGVFVALFILAVVGAVLTITAEYRRGLIGVTLAACPRRGRVLAAKAP